jgi:hypothetical protein
VSAEFGAGRLRACPYYSPVLAPRKHAKYLFGVDRLNLILRLRLKNRNRRYRYHCRAVHVDGMINRTYDFVLARSAEVPK